MFGNVALFGWPLVALILLRTRPLAQAMAIALIAGYLFLPLRFGLDLPLLPPLDKDSIPALSIIFIWIFGWGAHQAITSHRDGAVKTEGILNGWLPKNGIARLCLVALVVGAFMTVLTNSEALVYGARRLPAIRLFDAFSVLSAVGIVLLPFLIGRKFFASARAHSTLLGVTCIVAVLYAFLALYEVRMSPQLNRMVYGFFAHDWRQHIRSGGFRPIVFLQHGLLLGIFLSMALVASIGWLRGQTKPKAWHYLVPVTLAVTLVLVKTLGALILAVLIVPLALILRPRSQLLFAAVAAAMVLTYPMLRGANLVPVDRVVGLAAQIDTSRADSLQYRVENEDRLLAKAAQKPLFGWGGWGRSRVFDEEGRDIATTDGIWIITIGVGGWTKYLAEFGLLTLPIFVLLWRRKAFEIDPPTSILCLVLTVNLLDMIPNASITPLTWLIAGALLGRAELGATKVAETALASPRRGGGMHARGQEIPPKEALANADIPDQNQTNRYSRQANRHTRIKSR